MIITSKESKPTSLLDLLGGNGKSKDSKLGKGFAELLSNHAEPKKGGEFTALIDPKNSRTVDLKPIDTKNLKAKGLEELLMGKEDESKFFPKELIHALSNDQVHSLIHKAKEYLKNEITAKAPEYKEDHKAIPKTLMGLVELADKIGVKLTEITLTTIDTEAKSLLNELPTALKSKPIFELLPSTQPSAPSKTFEAVMQLLNDIKPVELKPTDAKTQKESSKEKEPLQALLKGLDTSTEITSVKETPKESPKASVSPVHFEALSTLLNGDNEKEHAAKETHKELKVETETHKTHQPHKVDSLEVKAKEAVQSMRHFAQDMKEAVENYKPPFTRITMKLNPERLGEVDVTLIQRGNNVHVNIQSQNTNSIAFLAHNATELKAQLAQNGITNATMNFMSGGENQQQQNPHQQQQEQNRFRAYQSFEELEFNQEELSALELIIPHYA